MDQLIGISLVNQIAGLATTDYMKGDVLCGVLEKLGVKPIGKDSSGWPLWFKSDIEVVANALSQAAIARRTPDVIVDKKKSPGKEQAPTDQCGMRDAVTTLQRYIDTALASVDESMTKMVNCVQQIVRVQTEIKRDQLIINDRITTMSSTLNAEMKAIQKTTDSELKIACKAISDMGIDQEKILKNTQELIKTVDKTRLNTLELISRGGE